MNKRVQLEKWQVQGVKTSVASNVNHGSDPSFGRIDPYAICARNPWLGIHC